MVDRENDKNNYLVETNRWKKISVIINPARVNRNRYMFAIEMYTGIEYRKTEDFITASHTIIN